MNAAAIARRLGGQRQGHNWRCPCPLDCGYSLSLGYGENGKLLAFCFGGCELDGAHVGARRIRSADDVDCGDIPVVDHHSCRAHRRTDAERIAQAREICPGGVHDDRIQIYLRSRGIELTSPVLRFAEHAPHRLGVRLPAMLAPVVNVSGEQTGVHMTYLRPNGGGKADLPKEFQRECRGVIRGGTIRLAEHDPGSELIVGEGVETTLSAMQIFGLAWSAVFAGGLKTIELPPDVRNVVIAADSDLSGIGQYNALAAHARSVAEGRSVSIKAPPDIGDDFNDVLTRRRSNAWR